MTTSINVEMPVYGTLAWDMEFGKLILATAEVHKKTDKIDPYWKSLQAIHDFVKETVPVPKKVSQEFNMPPVKNPLEFAVAEQMKCPTCGGKIGNTMGFHKGQMICYDCLMAIPLEVLKANKMGDAPTTEESSAVESYGIVKLIDEAAQAWNRAVRNYVENPTKSGFELCSEAQLAFNATLSKLANVEQLVKVAEIASEAMHWNKNDWSNPDMKRTMDIAIEKLDTVLALFTSAENESPDGR